MRRSRVVLVALLTVAANLLATPQASASPESDFVSRINAERSSRGMRALTVRADLTGVAERHSARMAREGRIYHNRSLGSQVSGWSMIGENVGRGGTVGAIHRMMMGSSSHRAVILNPRFNQLGVGVTKRGDMLYVSQVFVQRGAAKTSAPKVSTRTGRAPRATRAAPVRRVHARPRKAVVPTPPQTVELLVRMMKLDADL